MPPEPTYSLGELADLAGVTTRTVRYYLSQGLLPAVGQTGPGSKYDDRHLARLRLIRRLQAEHLPLAEIRRRLDELDEDAIRELASVDAPPPPTDSALDYLRGVLGDSARSSRDVGQPSAPAASFAPPPAFSAPVAPSAPALRATLSLPRLSSAAPVVGVAVPAAPAAPLPSTERSQWERVVLSPDIELHIRRPLTRAQNKQVDRLVTIARELLEEDRP